MLSEFYNDLEEEDSSALALVFASSDSDNSSFEEYYGTMPFYAVPFSATNKIQELGTRFGVRGIPSLIILDAADGSIKDADGRTTVAAAKGVVSKAVAKW